MLGILDSKKDSPYELDMKYQSEYSKVDDLPTWSLGKLDDPELTSKAFSRTENDIDEVDPDNGDISLHCAVSR